METFVNCDRLVPAASNLDCIHYYNVTHVRETEEAFVYIAPVFIYVNSQQSSVVQRMDNAIIG